MSSSLPSPSTSAAANACSSTPVTTGRTPGHGVTYGSSGNGTENSVSAS